jgi:hypothetical protein
MSGANLESRDWRGIVLEIYKKSCGLSLESSANKKKDALRKRKNEFYGAQAVRLRLAAIINRREQGSLR